MGMARAMTIARQSEVRGSWIFSVSLGQHGLNSKWSFRQETGVTEVHVSLLDLASLNLLGQSVPNGTWSSRMRRSKTSVAVVHVSSLDVAGWKLF
jgi:hypothetical protein